MTLLFLNLLAMSGGVSAVIEGPYSIAAAETYLGGAVASETFVGGAVKSETYLGGSTEGQGY